MTASALSQPRRRPIVSADRARTIEALVCERHGVAPEALRKQWPGRIVMEARRELACRLEHDLDWTVRQIANHLSCAKDTAHRLLVTGRPVYIGQKMHRQTVNDDCPESLREQLREMQAQLRRLSGVPIASRIAAAYGMRPMSAIVLAIMAEAYPRPMALGAIIEAYELACDALEFGSREGVGEALINSAIFHARARFTELGLPSPIESLPMGQRRLSHDVASILRERVGAPRVANAVVL